MSKELRSLRAQPFQLLLELDRRLRAMHADGGQASANIWQGLAFRHGQRWIVAPKEDVREVIAVPRTSRVPNARPWLCGVANIRGKLLTLIDLGRLFGNESSAAANRNARVLVLNSELSPVGFLVDEVAGYRQFTVGEQAAPKLADGDTMKPFVLGGFQREGRPWLVLSLHQLASSELVRRGGW